MKAPITTFYALIAELPEAEGGGEGLAMIYGFPRAGLECPLVMTDTDNRAVGGGPVEYRLDLLRKEARRLSKAGGRRIRLVRFTTRTDLEVFHPDGRREPIA